MNCPHKRCGNLEKNNTWKCSKCGNKINGGIVFVTGISGSGAEEFLKKVVADASSHKHKVKLHDIGNIMYNYAIDDDPKVKWNKILDAGKSTLRNLRARAFESVEHQVKTYPDYLHIIDIHLSFRWKAYLSPGFQLHILSKFQPYVRCFINLIEDISRVQERLKNTGWGKRKILELLLWRDEELFLTDLVAAMFDRLGSIALSVAEPSIMLEQIIWHPERKKVYLSFPITNIQNDNNARMEIENFRNKIRDFLIVFDPYASKDYDETYKRKEMKSLRKQIGEATEDRDYRFIDQADAIVVYYPKNVPSKGVDAEMNYARLTGKDIFLYCPEDLGGGPFAVPPSHRSTNPEKYIKLLKNKLKKRKK